MAGNMRALIWVAGVFALSVAAMQACSTDSGNTGAGGSGNGSGNGSATGASSAGGNNTGGALHFGGSHSGGAGTGGDCAAVSSTASEGLAPADIIIAVDTSNSMDLEAQWTQDNMNAMVSIIVGSGIDAHVIMIANNDICVPAPLGSGACPADDNLPSYLHVHDGVGSDNALEKIRDHYPDYAASLRPGATKTIVVISDDDSNLDAGEFIIDMVDLDPTFQGFVFHAIVASAPPWLNPCLLLSADRGQEYIDLVAQTGGVYGDLCGQNFAPVFQAMATAVVTSSQIDCVYDIPDTGEPIDYGKVNVDFKPGPNDPATPIYNVPGGLPDCDGNGGWYYDDPNNPSQILLCPATCSAVQGSTDGEMTVKFGCETLVGPPA